MVAAAADRGLEYYAITDHAPNLFMQRMTDEKALAQREHIRDLQDRCPALALLHGTELNIDPYGGVDWDAVFKAAARTGTALEIDSFPDRLDLPADLIRRAKRFGVKFSIDTDAHAVGHHRNIRYGIGTAQRGWLTPDDVINTWPLDRLRGFLDKP
jgi:histidinol phosphatase-like PHP family hydrolase